MNSTLKILILSTNADEAGAPKHVETVINGLKDKVEFIVVFGEKGPVGERLINKGHKVHVIDKMRSAISPFRDLLAIRDIVKIIKQHNPDLIHCHSTKAGMLGRISAFLCKKPWVYTVHGWGWRGMKGLSQKLIIYAEKILRFVPNGHYIFVAQSVESEGKLMLRKKIRGSVIYNGVPELGMNKNENHDDINILMPARVSSAKDHESLIKAFEIGNFKNINLIFCGTGTDDPKFIEWAKQLAPNTFQKIGFIGQQSNMAELYSSSQIVALISHFEALPLSIIEAMSCKKAIIASDIGGIPELISHKFEGLLVRPNATEDIISAINELSDKELRHFYGMNARAKYEKNFTEGNMNQAVLNIYESLCPENRNRKI